MATVGVAIATSLAFGAKKTKSFADSMSPPQRAWHALNRLTFGPRPGDLQHVMDQGVDNWIDEQLAPNKIDDSAIDARLSPLRTLRMSTRELLDNFPPPPLVKLVADGKMTLPSDPEKRAIYQAELERLREKQARQQQDRGDQGFPPKFGPQSADMLEPYGPSGENRSGQLMRMEPEQRYHELLRLSDGQTLPLNHLAPKQRELLLTGFTPAQRETAMALVNPQMVVTTELQEGKLLRAIYGDRQLEEVMTDFWFNHFNVFLGKGGDRYLITAYEREVIRPHALGKFKDLLVAAAQSPAMLFYLDNWTNVGPNSDFARYGPIRPRNRAGAANANQKLTGLNENYARELMELHTLGVNGGYTQRDVTEVAKVFTGWTLQEPRRGGDYIYLERRHEPGSKTVLGRTIKQHGEDEGRQVLDLLAHHPATAHFICTKLAQRFVSDNPPPALVDHLAKTFLKTDGDIREVLRTMFHSREFWSVDAYRAKVKTPLEFIASAVRASGADVQDAMPLVQALNRMGMPLYGAQPPTGYSMKAETWVNSAALLNRMNFALTLAAGRLPGVTVDSRQMLADYGPANLNSLQPEPTSVAGSMAPLAQLENALLAGNVSRQTHQTISQQLDAQREAGRAPNVGALTGLLLGSPEFQRK